MNREAWHAAIHGVAKCWMFPNLCYHRFVLSLNFWGLCPLSSLSLSFFQLSIRVSFVPSELLPNNTFWSSQISKHWMESSSY